ncbi:MAG: hypothetical protein QXV17_01510 [Candidatus Micrarchaeaceae archaeon]
MILENTDGIIVPNTYLTSLNIDPEPYREDHVDYNDDANSPNGPKNELPTIVN